MRLQRAVRQVDRQVQQRAGDGGPGDAERDRQARRFGPRVQCQHPGRTALGQVGADQVQPRHPVEQRERGRDVRQHRDQANLHPVGPQFDRRIQAVQRHDRQRLGRARVRQRQRQRLGGQMAGQQRHGAAALQHQRPGRAQPAGGEIEIVGREPAGTTGQLRDQAERAIAEPILRLGDAECGEQARRAGMAQGRRRGPGMPGQVQHRLALQPQVGEVGGDFQRQFLNGRARRQHPHRRRGPLQSPGATRPRKARSSGQQRRQRGRLRCLQIEPGFGDAAAVGERRRGAGVGAAHLQVELAQGQPPRLRPRVERQRRHHHAVEQRLLGFQPQIQIARREPRGQRRLARAPRRAARTPGPSRSRTLSSGAEHAPALAGAQGQSCRRWRCRRTCRRARRHRHLLGFGDVHMAGEIGGAQHPRRQRRDGRRRRPPAPRRAWCAAPGRRSRSCRLEPAASAVRASLGGRDMARQPACDASPGSTARTSRTSAPPPDKSTAARSPRKVPPAKLAASADRSIPVGNVTAAECSSTGSHASRSSRLAASARSSRGCGATRSATAPRAGEPPISIARSSAAARPPAIVTRPSARDQDRRLPAADASRSRPRAATRPPSVPSGSDLAGQRAADALRRPLPVQRHVKPGRAVRPRLGQLRGEAPRLARQIGRARSPRSCR